MKQIFFEIASAFTSDSVLLETLWKEIEKQYSHKSRQYHNLEHLETMLQFLVDHKAKVTDWAAMVFAVFYHDAIYKVLKSDNEEQSAELAEKRLRQIHFPEARIKVCKSLILTTKSHLWNAHEDANLLMDIDLNILGAPWEQYLRYAGQIRKEYSIYPDLMYKPGRKKVLIKFLERDFIYKTPDFRAQFEKQARLNLQQEIETI
jgi:predicted metal-dependent HD superfamily phosphohydrolase